MIGQSIFQYHNDALCAPFSRRPPNLSYSIYTAAINGLGTENVLIKLYQNGYVYLIHLCMFHSLTVYKYFECILTS